MLPMKFELQSYLLYAPETGLLLWRKRVGDMFLNGSQTAEHQAAKWNAKYADRQAGSAGENGYVYVALGAKKWLAHRLIWKMVFNTEPDEIDHIDGVRDHNSLSNLRSVDRAANMRNMKKSSRNTSGVTGVSYRSDRGVWRAYIHVAGRIKTLGNFATMDEARAARLAADEAAGYHANHGR